MDLVGKSGGLVSFWRREEEVEVLNFSQWHIHALIRNESSQRE